MSEHDTHEVAATSTESVSEGSTKFEPLRDPVTGAELVIRTPAPNSSAPAVPICSVISAARDSGSHIRRA